MEFNSGFKGLKQNIGGNTDNRKTETVVTR